ncbi:long-chain fatty acid--CoA ligase [Comamonas testosteroni]
MTVSFAALSPAHASPPPAPTRYWPGRVPTRLTVPQTSVWDNLAVNARRYPDHAALVFFEQVITYRQMEQITERLAAHLHAQGVQRGDRVILLMQNCPQLVLAHYAILRANAVVVPVNPMNTADELAHYITDADARVAITTTDLAGALAQANHQVSQMPGAEPLRHLLITRFADAMPPQVQQQADFPQAWAAWLLGEHALPDASLLPGASVASWQQALQCTNAPPPLSVGAADMAILPYTSGTTGKPKGCIHAHSHIQHAVQAGLLWGRQSTESVNLVVAPMFHITGMVSIMHVLIGAGATLVIMPRWDRNLAAGLMLRWRVTHWANIPTMVVDLLASPQLAQVDMRSLVYIGGGGAAMPQPVAQHIKDLWGLDYIEGYGMTETCGASHANPYEHPKQQCLGVPHIGMQSKVIDPATLQELPSGEVGEIVVRGPQVLQGYWKQPGATETSFVQVGGERFFRTGDLGYRDEDGYFFLTDRLKRMINASGYKVWPAEVESLMYRHPAILEACVISARDPYRGETVKAVVVLRPSHQGQVSEQDIIAWCHEHMAVYKAPRIVQLVDHLPKSGSGKVMWRLLQEKEL